MSELLQTVLPGLSAFTGAWLAHRFALRQTEHGTRFQRQYERRDEVIGETWRLLLEANNSFHNWTSPFGYEDELSKLEQGKDVYGTIHKFVSYYRSHMLWFDQRTLDKLNRFTDDISKHFHKLYDAFDNEHLDSTVMAERFEARRDSWRWAREELQEWLRDLDGDFRLALGVDHHSWWRRPLRLPRRHRSPRT